MQFFKEIPFFHTTIVLCFWYIFNPFDITDALASGLYKLDQKVFSMIGYFSSISSVEISLKSTKK